MPLLRQFHVSSVEVTKPDLGRETSGFDLTQWYLSNTPRGKGGFWAVKTCGC